MYIAWNAFVFYSSILASFYIISCPEFAECKRPEIALDVSTDQVCVTSLAWPFLKRKACTCGG
jgi:hypothetical protein